MRHSYRPAIPPPPQPYRTQVLDHLGLIAGMCEELGITEVIDRATKQDPEMRIVTAGHAVKAMVLNGLGFLNQQLYLVPHFFQHKPLARLIAPGIQASHLNDDTLGRALDTFYDFGVTALYCLIATTVDTQWLTQNADEVKAFQTLCRTAFACEADARQALRRFAHDMQTTFLSDSTIYPTPHYGKRGRPGPSAQPDQIVYHIAGALASRLTDRQARVDQHSCFILATNELDEGQLSAPAVLAGYKGQARAERGCRFLKDPQFLASSLSLKKPERIMALLMVMTVCLLVYAALEYRIRTVLKEQEATLPDQKGKRIPNPTVRWVFHYFVGIHVLSIPEQGLRILNLTDEHQHLLQLLGKRYAWFYR